MLLAAVPIGTPADLRLLQYLGIRSVVAHAKEAFRTGVGLSSGDVRALEEPSVVAGVRDAMAAALNPGLECLSQRKTLGTQIDLGEGLFTGIPF